ncbi:MAG: hydroxymethylbilane synthase [Candidatus Zixiibacteriota bacterium]|nr:MAG: hydroxymethylbilane synthase [candidate division Zixibacteria bacterium]
MSDDTIKIGTRGSMLAASQTNQVIELLKQMNPGLTFTVVTVRTVGDRDSTTSLEKMGGTGVFTAQIERELLEGTVDIAVHSAKDLPSDMTDDLTIGAVPLREACEDVWISGDNMLLADTLPGSVVGTGSPRRRAQILHVRPDLKVMDIRGNIETRLRKVVTGQYDALVMAHAGLKRAGLDYNITEILPPEKFVPAPGQGALAVQIRHGDQRIREIAASIDDPISHRCLGIERLLLRRLNAGCSAAVGGLAIFHDDGIRLIAVVLDKNGTRRLYAEGSIPPEQTDEALVDPVVSELLAHGAKEIIDAEG